jgi:hypothetical protein
MHCVVKIPGLSSIYSLTEVPAVRDGLEVEEGAWIEIPADIADYPIGTDNPPPRTLAVSKADPKHYKLFKYPEEVERDGFEPTGLSFGGRYSPSEWSRLAAIIPSMKRFESIKGNDRPGAMDEAMRYIREAR